MENIFNFKYLQTKIFNINITVCLSRACTPQSRGQLGGRHSSLGTRFSAVFISAALVMRGHRRAGVCSAGVLPTSRHLESGPLTGTPTKKPAMCNSQCSPRATQPCNRATLTVLDPRPPLYSQVLRPSSLQPEKSVKAQSLVSSLLSPSSRCNPSWHLSS